MNVSVGAHSEEFDLTIEPARWNLMTFKYFVKPVYCKLDKRSVSISKSDLEPSSISILVRKAKSHSYGRYFLNSS